MALDTRYRPLRYADVVGQEGIVTVLKEFVRSGSGFHQSYLLCGSHGSGKTTLGRILARALLCERPVNGEPCDECDSCRGILETGTAECFVEIDAATNSGKSDIKSIIETLRYDTFSGKRRIYLFDEAHRLSKDALDALLKPMEDTAPGSEEKLLTCIFCTTEPERMRPTIRSRCAPAFVIRRVTPEEIATRLAFVCEAEGIPYERDALVLIAETAESHIRDALKAVEGVAQMGGVTQENVLGYLNLNANPHYIAILGFLGRDMPQLMRQVALLQAVVSPGSVYEKLSDLAMLSYRVSIGAGKIPSYWNERHITALGTLHGPFLVQVAQVLGSKPGHPTYAMLECDLAMLHFQRTGQQVVQGAQPQPQPLPAPAPMAVLASPPASPSPQAGSKVPDAGTVGAGGSGVTAPAPPSPAPPAPAGPAKAYVTSGGVYIDPRAVRKRSPGENRAPEGILPPLSPDEFRTVLRRVVAERLNGRGSRST